MAVVGAVALTGCAGRSGDRDETVLSTWYEQTDDAVAALGPPPDPVAARTWALAWWAADRAIAGKEDGPFVDAAVARAVHDVLLALVPERQEALDDALEDGADEAGAGAGREAAAEVLALRSNDGLDSRSAEGLVTVPASAPGVWRPTPPELRGPRQVGLRDATPFLLRSADQLRPGPPPRPGSPLYRRDLAEVRELGRDEDSSRTPEQTAVALFWGGSELAVQVRLVREAMQAAQLSTADGARLLSAFHRITADAEIAVFDAKYTYFSWRPVTALQVDGDGDPSTPRIRDWDPLIATPGHPEYPSAHTVYAAAAAAVLAHFLGPAPARPLVVDDATSEGTRRTYTTWQQAVEENEDARVWAGIHFRTSDEIGSELGRRVAEYDLEQL
ncbi:MAG: vanadium-dependent haloperoxidase [Nocardioidaceae bacterium]|nr:vanadium-dependent haloperoxidase [Nocardioidaceae bacterium]